MSILELHVHIAPGTGGWVGPRPIPEVEMKRWWPYQEPNAEKVIQYT